MLRLFRRWLRGNLVVLMYHGVTESPLPVRDWSFVSRENFEAQLRYLTSRFDIARLEDVPAILSAKRSRPTAVLTFDDGFQNNHDVVLPLLRKARVPAAFFLVTGLIGTDATPWFCRIHRAVSETSLPGVDWWRKRYHLRDAEERAGSLSRMRARLKSLPPADFLPALADLLRQLGDDPLRPVEKGSPYRMLDWASVRAMADSGWASFGGHTVSHAILSNLDDGALRREICDSVDAIGRELGRPCRIFAYPNGRKADYDDRSIRLLRESGVEVAVAGFDGRNGRSAGHFNVRRVSIGSPFTMRHFQALLG